MKGANAERNDELIDKQPKRSIALETRRNVARVTEIINISTFFNVLLGGIIRALDLQHSSRIED
jgi:hypothetical protein